MIYDNENVAFYDPHFLSYQWWIFVNLQRGSGGTFADFCKLVLPTIHIMLPRIFPVYAKMLTNLLQVGHSPPWLPQKSFTALNECSLFQLAFMYQADCISLLGKLAKCKFICFCLLMFSLC